MIRCGDSCGVGVCPSRPGGVPLRGCTCEVGVIPQRPVVVCLQARLWSMQWRGSATVQLFRLMCACFSRRRSGQPCALHGRPCRSWWQCCCSHDCASVCDVVSAARRGPCGRPCVPRPSAVMCMVLCDGSALSRAAVRLWRLGGWEGAMASRAQDCGGCSLLVSRLPVPAALYIAPMCSCIRQRVNWSGGRGRLCRGRD